MGRISNRNKASVLVSSTLMLFMGACSSTSCNSCPVDSASESVDQQTAVEIAPAAPAPTMTREESLADFDAAWQLINDTHFDPEFNGVDWNAMRDEYRPMAEASTSRQQTRRVITSMLNTLEQSHFGVIPMDDDETSSSAHANASDDDSKTPASKNDTDALLDGAGNADLGMEILIIDRQAVVSEIRADGPADLAGIRTGWILSQVRDESVSERIEELADAIGDELLGIHGVSQISSRLQGPEGSTINLTFLNAADQPREYTLTREDMPGEAVTFGNLPPMQTSLDWGWYDSDQYNLGDKKVGYISFTIWMMPIAAQFEEAMVALQDADGIVIDLRGNPGGIAGLGAGIARYFVTEKSSLGTMMMRGQKMVFNVSPIVVTRKGERLKPFTNPVAILTDQGSASTSEFFAGGLQALERVEVFGTRSAGMALSAAMDKLPSGDVLLHAISDYKTSKGNAIEATGVIPEHPIPAKREDLLNGIDAPTHAAVDWIKYAQD